MARTIHVDTALTCTEDSVYELLSYNESPDHPGLTRRICSRYDGVMIAAFVFTRDDGSKRCRFAGRIWPVEKARAYRRERNAIECGAGI